MGQLPKARLRQSRTIQSVSRALSLLEILSESDRDLTLKELSTRIGLNASTCHHLLATLAKHQFVGQTPHSRGYFLGMHITELSDSRLRQFSLKNIAMPKLAELSETTSESTHLMALKGDALVLLANLESKYPVRVGISDVKYHEAAHATASGKAILAWLPEGEIVRVLAKSGLRRFTPATICTINDLMEDLRHVRRNGYAMDNEEFQPGVICVGGAIRDRTGAVVGAVSVSLPLMRAVGAHLDEVRDLTKQCAMAISAGLGNQGANEPPDDALLMETDLAAHNTRDMERENADSA